MSVAFDNDLNKFVELLSQGRIENVDGQRVRSLGVELAVRIAREEIERDVKQGRVPREVASFSELHDHVDANGYGRAFDWPGPDADIDDPEYVQELIDFWNTVHAELDDHIRSGRLS